MRPHPPTQPALGLPTMNAHCEQVRKAAAAAARATELPTEQLQALAMHVDAARRVLMLAYTLAGDEHALKVQVETAGKAVRHLLTMVEFRLKARALQ